MYHNKIHLHYASFKKRLARSSIKHQIYFFKKVCVAALNFAYIFLILTRVFSQQKSRLVFHDIKMRNTALSFLSYSLLIEVTSCNCSRFCALLITKIRTCFFLLATPFCNSALVFLNLSSVKHQMMLRLYLMHINMLILRDFSYFVYVCIYIVKIVDVCKHQIWYLIIFLLQQQNIYPQVKLIFLECYLTYIICE